ncbi:hypothetical protein ACFMPD_05695 [Sedimentitalea sp. HM32M-2]|uniref:hypothetical protein n=1 Tax=Sedimentitalea sp. HM32M-2 TaxID=3351566 RepID=UPI0036413557
MQHFALGLPMAGSRADAPQGVTPILHGNSTREIRRGRHGFSVRFMSGPETVRTVPLTRILTTFASV